MTTIKEHIEAGHYPKNEHGYSLVPCRRCGLTMVVVATHMPGSFPLVGYHQGTDNGVWVRTANGHAVVGDENEFDLLPPLPRKVQSMATLCIPMRNGRRDNDRKPMVEFGDITSAAVHNKEWQYVLLTGEYEEPWS